MSRDRATARTGRARAGAEPAAEPAPGTLAAFVADQRRAAAEQAAQVRAAADAERAVASLARVIELVDGLLDPDVDPSRPGVRRDLDQLAAEVVQLRTVMRRAGASWALVRDTATARVRAGRTWSTWPFRAFDVLSTRPGERG